MTSPAKRGLIIMIILILLFPFLCLTVLEPLFSPEPAIEFSRSEESDFLCVAEEYIKFPKEKDSLRKINTSTGKASKRTTIWEGLSLNPLMIPGHFWNNWNKEED